MKVLGRFLLFGSLILLATFIWAESRPGQAWLGTHAGRHLPGYAGLSQHQIDDDIAMGISIAPVFFLLMPGAALFASGMILEIYNRRHQTRLG